MVDRQQQNIPPGSVGVNYTGQPPFEAQSLTVAEDAIDKILQNVAEKKYNDYINQKR